MTRALWLSSGVLVWALHFAIVYGYTGLACARAMDRSVPWTVGIATLALGAVAALLFVRGFRRRGDFEHALAAGLAGFALLAIAWEGASVLMVVPCGGR